MAFDIPTADNLARSNQILAGADALLAGGIGENTQGTSTSTAALNSLGALDLTDIGSGASDAITTTLNQNVIGLHQELEGFADQNGLAGSVHGVTNLGETLGLGHIGQGGNLLTDLGGAVHDVTAGDTGVIGSIVSDAVDLEKAASSLPHGIASDVGINDGALGLVPNASSVTTAPVESSLNGIVDDVHATLEGLSDSTVLPGTVHGITGLGNAIGLGNIGGSNLLTDVLHLPGDLSMGDLSSVEHLPGDVAQIISGVEGVVSGLLSDIGQVGNSSNPAGALTGLPGGLEHAGAGGVLGEVNGLLGQAEGLVDNIVGEVHATLEGISDMTPFAGTVHGVTGLGNAIGLSDTTGSNLVGDLLHAPSAVAPGDLTPITNLPGDLGAIVGGIGNLANGVGSDIGSSPLTGMLEHPATGSGSLGGNLPGQGVLGALTGQAGSLLDGGHGAAGAVSATISGVVSQLGDHGHGILGLVGSNGSLANAVDGITGGLSGGGSGSHDLATATVGPQTPTSGLQVDVLSQSGGASHPIDVHAGTVPSDTPTVANVGVLTGGSFHFSSPTGGGGDALSGLASSLGASAPHATAAGAPPAVSAIDAAPAAHADVPAAAAAPHPLEALAHPIAHAA